MKDTKNRHNQAMDLVEAAIVERSRGNAAKTVRLYAEALELELTAIAELEQYGDRVEPTWSVLHRSAGWMAFNSGQPRLAERLACKALAENPHPEVAAELRDLLEQVRACMADKGEKVSSEGGGIGV